MSKTFLFPLSAVILMTNAACAGPVDRSLRPEARPSALSVVQTTPAQATLAPPVPAETRAAFDRWAAGFKSRAQAQGIRPAVLERAFAGIGYDPSVIERDRNQAEFKREIWDYLDSAASPVRVANGQAALQKHRRALQAIEDRFGVEKEVVTAVWGLESSYGDRRGTMDVVQSLATLAHDGRRGAFFEKQLIGALQIIQAGDVDPRRMTGSWAGAMGHTQFIPTSYLAYAVDFTGDGKRDIWSDDPTDALASTAAYLKRFGWTKGQPWGVEVRLPAGFNANLAKRDIKRSPSEWAAMGVTDMQGRAVPNHGQAAILLPAGTAGAAFMIFDNFGVIARYNNAEAYVIGVGHLSDRIKGGPEIQTAWPRGYAPLSFDERMEMQQRLQARGYPVEKIDGIIGPQTTEAIRAFQRSIGVNPDGFPSQDVLALLKR
ncbi:MAG: lytic murein transglycosylase [Alphaproteobacteria bacterium]